MFLERVIQVYPASLAYWLGILFLRRNFILAEIAIEPTKDQAKVTEFEKAVWHFYDQRPSLNPNDRSISIERKDNILIFRKLWIVVGLFTRNTYRIGESNFGIGFPTNS